VEEKKQTQNTKLNQRYQGNTDVAWTCKRGKEWPLPGPTGGTHKHHLKPRDEIKGSSEE
jgi:hypothetical protein